MCLKMPLKTCKNITLCHVLSEHKQVLLPIAHVTKNGCHNHHNFVGFCSIELQTATRRSDAIIAFLENLGPCIGLTLKRRLRGIKSKKERGQKSIGYKGISYCFRQNAPIRLGADFSAPKFRFEILFGN